MAELDAEEKESYFPSGSAMAQLGTKARPVFLMSRVIPIAPCSRCGVGNLEFRVSPPLARALHPRAVVRTQMPPAISNSHELRGEIPETAYLACRPGDDVEAALPSGLGAAVVSLFFGAAVLPQPLESGPGWSACYRPAHAPAHPA